MSGERRLDREAPALAVAITLLAAGITRFFLLGPLPIEERLEPLGRVAVADALGLACALAVVGLLRPLLRPLLPASGLADALRVAAGAAAGVSVFGAALPALGLPAEAFGAVPVVQLLLVSESVTIRWVVAGLLRDWRTARRTRDELETVLAEGARLNDLLLEAERELGADHALAVRDRVVGPLDRIRRSAATKSDEALADALDDLIEHGMRPLAHVVHPVAVRTGLIPALRSLGPRFRVSADETLAAADAAGTLLDDDVRLQAYAWLRRVEPPVGVRELAFGLEPAAVRIRAVGLDRVPPLDPVGLVAGLRLEPDGALVVPRRGEPRGAPVFDAASDAPDRPHSLAIPAFGRTLAVGAPVDVRLVLAVAISAPVHLFPAALLLDGGALSAGLASGVVPILAALVLARIPTPSSGALRRAWSIGQWLLVAAVASGVAIAVSGFVAANPLSGRVLATRSALRYFVMGSLFQLARGSALVAEEDSRRLREALATMGARRAELLSAAEATDRFVSEALHGSVQGRLSAVSLLLRLGRRDEALAELDHVCDEMLPRIVERLADGRPLEPVAPDGPGGLTIEDAFPWTELETVAPRLVPALRRVVAECAANASRHGGARTMRVGGAVGRSDGQVSLTCEDDGRGPAGERRAGLGSRLFDEVCAAHAGTWRLDRRPDGPGARFELRLRLGAGVP